MAFDIDRYTGEAFDLLQQLIAIPSFSREEKACSDFLASMLHSYGMDVCREGCNIFAVAPDYVPGRQTILLNAHIDTVRPVVSWTRDPFAPVVEGDRLYGLGSNDCGGGLVSLLQAFRIFASGELPGRYNLVWLASAEEEVSGKDGIERVLPRLPHIDTAIVGEPTDMQPAIAERGLMVLDLVAHGKSGHAARDEGINAIYAILDDINWIRSYRFKAVSELLGETRMQVTQITAGTQHNVVPDVCRAVVDVRTNEFYTNEKVFAFVREHCRSEVKARSFRLNSSQIDPHHPLIERCKTLGLTPFGSPTLSDQALMPFPSFKLGPGSSARSHSADEYICRSEIRRAIEIYTELLQ
ncbi:MAG: M20 family metallo-hydrolase [Prevotella sp.]|nr:M20 family metallo-hydrolase [Prevotella sp.]